MSVAGQARHVRGSLELLYDTRKENNILHALIRDLNRKPGTVSSRPIGSVNAGPTLTNTNIFTEPIAFHPIPFIITADEPDTLRIDKNFGAYSSRVIVTGQGGTDDDISTIIGLDDGEGNTGKAAFAGQLCIIDAALSGALTLKEGTTFSLPGAADLIIPAGQNQAMIYDSTSDRWQVLSATTAALWSTFPAITNVDMKGFTIFNIGNLLFDDIVGGVASATNPTMYYDLGNTELVIQTNASEQIVLRVGTAAGGLFARMDENLIDFSLSLGSEFRVRALRVFDISQFDKDMTLDIPLPSSSGNPVFKINAVVTDANFGGDLGTITLPWNNLNVEQIRLRAGDVIIDIPSITRIVNDMVLNVDTANAIRFQERNADRLVLDYTANELQLIATAINMGGNNVNDVGIATVDNLLFNDSVGGVGSATNPTIYYDLGNTELVIQTNSADQIVLRSGTGGSGLFARMDESLIDYSLSLGSEFRVRALRVFDISQFDADMTLDIPTPSATGNPVFKINAVVTDANFGGDLGTIALPWNNLNVEQIRLREGDEIIDISSIATRAGVFRLNYKLNDSLAILENGVIQYQFFNNKLDLNLQYLQFDAQANPGAAPATERFLFADSSNSDRLSIRTPTTTIDLEAAGGGSQTPITSDIQYAGFDIKDLSNIEFRNTTGVPAASVRAMYANAGGLIINVAAAQRLEISVNNIDAVTFDTSEALFSVDVVPVGSKNLGSSGNSWAGLFLTQWTLATGQIIRSTGGNIVIETSTTDDIIFREVGTEFLRMDGGINASVFSREIKLDGTNRAVRAFDATEIGFFVSNVGASVGAEGSIELPFTTTASPSDAQLNTAFGSFDGACGISGSTASIPRWQIRVNNNWNQVDMTNSN